MKSGDIVLAFKGALFSRLIRLVTRRKNNPVVMTHSGIMIESNTYMETDIRARLSPIEALYKCEYWEIWQYPEITDLERVTITTNAKSYFNKTYSITKLMFHAFDAILGKILSRDIFFFRKLSKSDKYIVCSWIPSSVYHKIGIDFINPYYVATPDNIHDFLKEHNWKLVNKKV